MYKTYSTTDNQQIIINTDDGSTYMTARSYSELVAVDRATILFRVAKNPAIFIGDVETASGLKTHRLIPESVIGEWLKIDKPMVYESLVLGEGIRSYLHGLVSYKSGGEVPYE